MPLVFHRLSGRFKQYSAAESPFYQLKQYHITQGFNRELPKRPFSSLSPLTTKHCDRYLLTVAPIIDLFICLEACCYVTTTNGKGNCHSSTFGSFKLSNERAIQTEARHIYYCLLCVNVAVLVTVERVC